MEKLLDDFKGTGEYNQMLTKIRHLIDIASGHLPTTGAVQITPWLYVEIMPTFDYGVTERKQTGWQLIFVDPDENGCFCFENDCICLNGVGDCPYYTWIRKKDGKAKATEKFTDAVFLYIFKNGACVYE